MNPWLSIVIAMRNEAPIIERTLAPLQALRAGGVEIIVVDGQSEDPSPTIADPLCDQLLSSPPGRARQMNAGWRAAQAPLVWFLHADSGVEEAHIQALRSVTPSSWGFFAIRLSSPRWPFRIIERLMCWRSTLTGVGTGDQGIFASTDRLRAVGGLPDIALMEDVALSKRLRATVRPEVLRPALVTSSRRWEHNGIARTVLLMWALRAAFWVGVNPERLARWYGGR